MNFAQYTTKTVENVFDELKTSKKGLSSKEADKRLGKYGPNEIRAKEAGLLTIFGRQFKSPFFYLLFIAALIAFVLGENIDGLIIVIFVLINVSLGFFQEARAHKAVSLLKKYISSKTKVVRDGIEKIIDKKFVGARRYCFIEAGNIIPADLRISKLKFLLVDESVLTGESAPVSKISDVLSGESKEIFQAENIAFTGTSVISGEAEGVVINTGQKTAFGEITKLVSGITRESAYEKDLSRISRLILKIVVVSIVFIFLLNLTIKGTGRFLDFLVFSIALIVTIIPEALPLIVTFALSGGALKLAKEKVVVKRLSALEDLGNVEILCTDKTGTLTEGRMKLEKVFSEDKDKCLSMVCFLLPQALLIRLFLTGFNGKDLHFLKNYKSIQEIPFDSFRMRNSVLLETPEGKLILIVKGAPEIILKLSLNIDGTKNKDDIINLLKKEGKAGKRVLAIGYKEINKKSYAAEDEKDLTFLGCFSFTDPLKNTAKESISLARKLGLKIKILTGDSREVAGVIAKEIGLISDSDQVISGEELDSMSDR